MSWLWKLFSSVHDSTKGLINDEELKKAIFGSLGVSGLSGLAILMLTGISTHAAEIFPDPAMATTATFALYLVIDLLRRRGDGQSAVLLPPGSTVPSTGALAPPPADVPTIGVMLEEVPQADARPAPEWGVSGRFVKQPRPGESDGS